MPGLTKKDIDILAHYAGKENRELYWNYLSQLPGNDGYGLLALGVVRNDNVPGQVANTYAQDVARHTKPGMSERDWEQFGVDLMQRDLAARQQVFKNDPAQALNLPSGTVIDVHDDAFENAGIDKEAWTPRKLMDMAQKKGGEPAMDGIWSGMLDNQKLGLYRGIFTVREVMSHTDLSSPASIKASAAYVWDMGAARAVAHAARPNTDPDLIGAQQHYYRFDRSAGTWTEIRERLDGGIERMPVISQVTDPKALAQLNDTRDLRLQRQALREQFHPDDTYRSIAKSPQTVADARDARNDLVVLPAQAMRLNDAMHPDHALYRNVQQALRAQLPDGAVVSEDRLAQLTTAAKEARIGTHERIDLLVGETLIVMWGQHPAHVAKVDLAAMPVPSAQDSAQKTADIVREQAEQMPSHRQPLDQQQAHALQHS